MSACCTCPVCGSQIPDDAFIVDLLENVAIRNGEIARLSPLETSILYVLWQSRPSLVSYDSVISGAWGINTPDGVRSCLNAMLSRIRRKVAPLGVDVRTVAGQGLYLATNEVRFVPQEKPGRPKVRAVA